MREGYEAERRSRTDDALYAITTIRRSLSRYRMAVHKPIKPPSKTAQLENYGQFRTGVF